MCSIVCRPRSWVNRSSIVWCPWVHAENVYDSSCVISSYNVFFSRLIEWSNNMWYCDDCIGCTECLGCTGLRNVSYHIENIGYEKDEYLVKKQTWIQSQSWANTIPVDFARTVLQSSDVEDGLFCFNVHRGRNVAFSGHKDGLSDVSDAFMWSWGKDYAWVCHSAGDSEYVYCSVLQRKCFDTYYCYFCEYCSFCFGCVGLKNKEFCIYNKQYTKETRYETVNQIFSKMEAEWTLWCFFPGSLCPFNFNDSAASLIEDFSKEEVVADGFMWREEELKVDIPDWMDVVETTELWSYESRDSWRVVIDPAILKKVIRDEKGNSYRVIKLEYDFLMKYGLPLPRKHWLERLRGHFRR